MLLAHASGTRRHEDDGPARRTAEHAAFRPLSDCQKSRSQGQASATTISANSESLTTHAALAKAQASRWAIQSLILQTVSEDGR